MGFKISLAGDLGSGKSTVSKLIIARTGAEYYSTGTVCRAKAAEHGMSIDEFNRYMETHPEIDKMIDDDLAALSDDPRTLIIDSRMAFHFVRGTFRVYLTVAPRVSAERILNDKRNGESFGTVAETEKRVAARRKSENLRYFEKYGVHIMDMQNYDLVLDTTVLTPEQVSDLILASLDVWQKAPDTRLCYLDYRRFMASEKWDDAKMADVRLALENGKNFPLATVYETDGLYYVESGLESILAHAIQDAPIVPCRILPGMPTAPEAYHPLFEKEAL